MAVSDGASPLRDVESVVASADRLHTSGEWSGLSIDERCALLAKAPEHLAAVEQEMALADARETGVPLGVTQMIDGSLKEAFSKDALKGFAAKLRVADRRTLHGTLRQVYKPHGPAVIIAPWNVPSGTVMPKVLAALLVGCPVIVKPSEVAPTGLELFLGAIAKVGLPAGALQCIQGGPEVGEKLVRDPRVGAVHFTGSADVGREVAAHCASRFVPVSMECGGSNVAIVLPDADVDAVAPALATGLTLLNGQWCAGISRIFVPASLSARLMEAVLAECAAKKVGDATSLETELGPLCGDVHRRSLEALRDGLRERGCSLRQMLLPADLQAGNFFAPTLVETEGAMEEVGEIFGPMATVSTFEDVSDAIRRANLRPLLQSYVFGSDRDAAISIGQKLRCGSVMVNGVGFGWNLAEGYTEPATSFFGGSGIGVEAGIEGLFCLFAGLQNVGVNG
eukprot:TRINITY_DN25500_c0_g1_i1.p1 TRINITY_DN25500_c0_g1~~TRINITY_DN25500_c0_g1_i1.p1  ORF type:complete len:452 (-),score=91.03 TRINITY_DN25500_c0_g1_i1:132-1487(-)